MADPEVTVIIPVYKDLDRLALCLEALGRQTLERGRFEVLVVDNGGNPGIEAVVACLPNARLLAETKPGSYAARNRGLREARGTVVAFTDSDCLPDARWLEEALRALAERPEAGLVGGRVELFAQRPDRPTAAEIFELGQSFPQDVYVQQRHFAATANMATHRAVLDAVGPFTETLRSGGDAEWGHRVHDAGYPLVYAPDMVVRHPARRTFGELAAKARRTKGGRIQRNRAGMPVPRLQPSSVDRHGRPRRRAPLVGLMIEALPPVERFRQFRSSSRIRLRRRDSVRVFFLLWGLGLAQLAEAARLRAGGRQLR